MIWHKHDDKNFSFTLKRMTRRLLLRAHNMLSLSIQFKNALLLSHYHQQHKHRWMLSIYLTYFSLVVGNQFSCCRNAAAAHKTWWMGDRRYITHHCRDCARLNSLARSLFTLPLCCLAVTLPSLCALSFLHCVVHLRSRARARISAVVVSARAFRALCRDNARMPRHFPFFRFLSFLVPIFMHFTHAWISRTWSVCMRVVAHSPFCFVRAPLLTLLTTSHYFLCLFVCRIFSLWRMAATRIAALNW